MKQFTTKLTFVGQMPSNEYVCSFPFFLFVLALVGCYVTCLGGRVTYYLLVMPWAIFCALVSILDVVAVGFFFYDLFNTLVCTGTSSQTIIVEGKRRLH